MGAQVMTLWEHIYEVNPKFMAILMAELEYQEKRKWSIALIINLDYIIELTFGAVKANFVPFLISNWKFEGHLWHGVKGLKTKFYSDLSIFFVVSLDYYFKKLSQNLRTWAANPQPLTKKWTT